MKKSILVALMMVMTITASARGYNDVRRDAKFMTDRMAYELRLTDRQYRAVYAINARFAHDPVHRDRELSRVLTPRQFEKYLHHMRAHRPALRHHVPGPRHHKAHYAHLVRP